MSAAFDRTSEFFTSFRKEFGFVYFPDSYDTDWFRSVGMWGVGITYLLAVLLLTIVLAFLGTRGYSRWRVTLEMIISLTIGLSIIVSATGISWQRADYTRTEDGIQRIYSVNIGLRQANITFQRINTTDDYKELEYRNVKIGWIEITQAEQEYHEAILSGWPLDILRIAHYLSIDVGGMRYMRAFRWSGYAVYILLWFAFSTWLLSNILLSSKISYGAILLLLTGCIQLLSCIVYDAQQPSDFYIPLDDGNPKSLLFRYDWMFWITLFTGLFVVIMSIILLVLDYLRPEDMNKFFGTQSEFLSPHDDEIKQHANKDLKGLIRNISIKMSGGRKKKVLIDTKRQPDIIVTDESNGKANGSVSIKDDMFSFDNLGMNHMDEMASNKEEMLPLSGKSNDHKEANEINHAEEETKFSDTSSDTSDSLEKKPPV